MKLIISGGRDHQLTPDEYKRLDVIHSESPVTEVESGKARGVDSCGEFWARRNRLPVRSFYAEWQEHGKQAGPLRNLRMAQYADAVALFPGGRGTDSMRKIARKNGLKIYDFSKMEEQPLLL